LTAEGCRKGVCIKYRVWVFSRDRRRWEVWEMWRKKKWDKEVGCLRQNVVDALWEPSGKYDVDVWYEYIKEWVRASINTTSSAALS
jgi:hypothetical protein